MQETREALVQATIHVMTAHWPPSYETEVAVIGALKEHPEAFHLNESELPTITPPIEKSVYLRMIFHIITHPRPEEWSPVCADFLKSTMDHLRNETAFLAVGLDDLIEQVEFLIECYEAKKFGSIDVVTTYPTHVTFPYLGLMLHEEILERWRKKDNLTIRSLSQLYSHADPAIQPFFLEWVNHRISERISTFTLEKLTDSLYDDVAKPIQDSILKHYRNLVKTEEQLIWVMKQLPDEADRYALILQHWDIALNAHALEDLGNLILTKAGYFWAKLFNTMKTGAQLERVLAVVRGCRESILHIINMYWTKMEKPELSLGIVSSALSDFSADQYTFLKTNWSLIMCAPKQLTSVLSAITTNEMRVSLVRTIVNHLENAAQLAVFVEALSLDWQLYFANYASSKVVTVHGLAGVAKSMVRSSDSLAFVKTHTHLIKHFNDMMVVAEVLPIECLPELAELCKEVFFGETLHAIKPFTAKLNRKDLEDFMGTLFGECVLERPSKQLKKSDGMPHDDGARSLSASESESVDDMPDDGLDGGDVPPVNEFGKRVGP